MFCSVCKTWRTVQRSCDCDVALLLREGQPSDDDVLALIRGAVTTSGGRAHTLPIIAQWAQEQRAPEFLTAIGLSLETYKDYPGALTWYTRAAEAGQTAASAGP